ncbi:sialidase family protein [Frateuria aurantia]
MSKYRHLGWLLWLAPILAVARPPSPGDTFISADPPTKASHASTLVQTRNGTVLAAWFGGTAERAPDVQIWLSRRTSTGWTPPVALASGLQADGKRYPTWNPVLFQPRQSDLQLYYKVGPDPQHWWGMVMHSSDDGRHWSTPVRLPAGILGPIRNPPVQLADGSILSPSSTEDGAWHVHMERSVDGGMHWTREPDLDAIGKIEAIQPTLVVLGPQRVLALGRTRQNKVFESTSVDGGLHWTPMRLLELANPNSAVDAIRLRDGRLWMLANPTHAGPQWWDGRGRLDIFESRDGLHWHSIKTLENTPGAEFSYPCLIQTRDGTVLASYTWKRQKIRLWTLDPTRL